eukprot:CAMPEP_0183745934 /NCGR_PEP_ID=MMETSP0737-20130205/66496_1 /TAXON_ID=385413 /ORGANISM="Thalassiosira miniscula, Strain CCMP1093" /LENGTH=419 /DNA_ID=CAMNT_0025981613 /DNA_START=176 /DNA_END=1435 /DNA_ORIENTATION=-
MAQHRSRERSPRRPDIDTRSDGSCGIISQAEVERRDGENPSFGKASDGLSVKSGSTDLQSLLPLSLQTWIEEETASVASRGVQSQANSVDTTKLTYWSSISVRAAIAVMQASGSERMAKKAAKAVLDARNKRRPSISLRKLATDVSVAIIKAGGDHDVVAAVTVAIMNSEDDASLAPSVDVTRARTGAKLEGREVVTSSNSSVVARRGKLKEKEKMIAEKAKVLKEAKRKNLQKEKEIEERLAALDAAEVALLESANIDRVVQERVAEYQSIRDKPTSEPRNSDKRKGAKRSSDKPQNNKSNAGKSPQQPQVPRTKKHEPMNNGARATDEQQPLQQTPSTPMKESHQQSRIAKRNSSAFSLFSKESSRKSMQPSETSTRLESTSQPKIYVGRTDEQKKTAKKGKLPSFLRKKSSKLVEV